MITGEFSFAAVSMTAFIELRPDAVGGGKGEALGLGEGEDVLDVRAGDDAGGEVVAGFSHEPIVAISLRWRLMADAAPDLPSATTTTSRSRSRPLDARTVGAARSVRSS